jgi:hypothetical protein
MKSSPSPEPSRTSRRRRPAGRDRHPHGRAWVAALWAVLRVGDLPLAWTAFRAADPAPQWRIPVVVCILWTSALFLALWLKQTWARPVTAIVLAVCACWWGADLVTAIAQQMEGGVPPVHGRFPMVLTASLLDAGVAVTVLRSANIRFLIDPTAGWKPGQF